MTLQLEKNRIAPSLFRGISALRSILTSAGAEKRENWPCRNKKWLHADQSFCYGNLCGCFQYLTMGSHSHVTTCSIVNLTWLILPLFCTSLL